MQKKIVKYTWKEKLASGAVADPIIYCMKCKVKNEREEERKEKLKEEKDIKDAK